MTETKYPVFQKGDRVIGTAPFDWNDDIVGMTGTVRFVEGDDMYAVEYDDEIKWGHNCCVNIPHGHGWHTHAKALAPYQDEPAESVHSISYEDVMI